MPDLELLTQLLSSLEDAAPAVNDDLCLNRRYKAANCSLCEAACPVAAIAVYGPSIHLDADLCARCGLCLNVCPSGVFSTPRQADDNKRLLDAAGGLRARPLELTCPANTRPRQTSAPVDAVLQTGRCLAALSTAELIDLASSRSHDLWLNDEGCADCPLGAVQPAIEQAAARANRVLAAWQRPVRVHSRRSRPQALVAAREVDQFSGSQPSYSRREFFLFLRRSAAQVVSAVTAESLAPAPPDLSTVPPITRQGHELPFNRRHLTAALGRLGTAPAAQLDLAGLPWADLAIDEHCTGCSLCARFCPTAALRWESKEDVPAAVPGSAPAAGYALHFIAADCIDCGICAAACPEAAIVLSERIEPQRLFPRSSRFVHGGRLGPCKRCGTLTDLAVRETCYICERTPSQVRPAP